jgi:hypothetical protein
LYNSSGTAVPAPVFDTAGGISTGSGGMFNNVHTAANSTGSGQMINLGDSVPGNNIPFCYSYLMGGSGGARAFFGFNFYAATNGSIIRPNTGYAAYCWEFNSGSGADAPLTLHSITSGNVGATPLTISEAGALTAAVSLGVGSATTGPTWTTGAGAPASTQPIGSLYSNTSGAVGATLYVSRGGGTWNAVAGV